MPFLKFCVHLVYAKTLKTMLLNLTLISFNFFLHAVPQTEILFCIQLYTKAQ